MHLHTVPPAVDKLVGRRPNRRVHRKIVVKFVSRWGDFVVFAAAGVPINAPKATTETGMGFAAASGSDAYAKQYEEAPKGLVSQSTAAAAPLAASGDKPGWMLPPPPPPPTAAGAYSAPPPPLPSAAAALSAPPPPLPPAATAYSAPQPPLPMPPLPFASGAENHQPPASTGAPIYILSAFVLSTFQDASVSQEAERAYCMHYSCTPNCAVASLGPPRFLC